MTSIDQSIGIRPIHIRFTTNANPSVEKILTRDMIYVPEKQTENEEQVSENIEEQKQVDKPEQSINEEELSTYPFFTDTVRLPMASILKLSKSDQIKLLFNRAYFNKKIGNRTYIDNDERNANAEYNLKAMLNILLPTSFPVKNNIYETFSGNIKGLVVTSDFQSDSSIFDTLFSDEENKYGYVNIDGNTWTVVKINLINDLINDKTFSLLLQSGNVFKTWKKQKIEDYERSINELDKSLTTLIKEKLPDIQKQLTIEPGKTGKDQSSEAARERMQLDKGSGNVAGVIVPTRFLIPHIDNLVTTTDKESVIEIFNKINNLRLKSGPERMESFIPLAISRLNGFNDILKQSSEYSLKKKMIEQLSSLKKVYNIIKEKRQDKVEDPVLKELLRNRELEAFLREVAKYRPPNRYYSNKNLSSILENIDSNIDEFLEFIDYISQINIENERPKQEILSNEQMSDRLKTGVMIVSEEPTENKEKDDILRLKTKYHYDCLLNLQLIDGKVDDDNIEDVKCPYRNQMLNIMYNNLKYAEQKNPVLFYIESKPFDMAKTQKGGRKHIRKTKKGGYLGKSVSSVRKTIRSLGSSSVQEKKKKRRNRRKSNRQIQSVNPYN